MQRVIKFRALKDDMSNCNFVYGQLVYDAIGQPRITEVDSSGQGLVFHTCFKGTESQFTGLQDKNGKDIYEGDKFSTEENDGSYYLIEWDNELSGFCVNLYSYTMHHNEGGGEEFDSNITMVDKNILGVIDLIDDEIIGNIYESPELLNN